MARYRIEYLTQWGWKPVACAVEGPRAEIKAECKRYAQADPKRTYRTHAVPFPKVGRGDIAYFDSDHAARHAARRVGWPEDRIVPYDLGYAIQRNPSGAYLTRGEWMAHPEH